VIREDPTDARILYAGTDVGVYVSTTGGESWDVLGVGLPSTFVFDLAVHPRDNIVIAATHGRGMWVLDATPVQKVRQSQ
jgi:ligand-binding sensor domain-containing protein